MTEPRHAMVTVLMLDVCDFTAWAHSATAREAVDFLDELYAVAVPTLERHGGRATKLLGDGVMSVFGAPDPLPDHADRAVEAAIEVSLSAQSRLGDRFRVGIGLNSGLVITGTVGAGSTRELAVVGDPVNVAARLEKATRELDEPVLISEATRCLLERTAHQAIPCGTITAKGKPDPIKVHALERMRSGRFRNDFRTTCP